MPGIARWGAYIPTYRLERAMLGRAWDTPALPGERAVCAGDEDALSMGVEAAIACLGGAEAPGVDAILFATTTPPYAEKQAAATIASVLDRQGIFTADVTGSLRAATIALRAALDAVRSGSARAALVVAADNRPAEPATAMEQLFGDAAAAVLVTADGAARITGEATRSDEFTGPWRRTGDPFVRSFDGKLETEHGYLRSIEAVVAEALASAGVGADAISRFAAYAPDPRTYQAAAKRCGFGGAKDALFLTLGNLGCAHALVSLASALDEAAPGEAILLAGAGDGADAFVVVAAEGIEGARPNRTVAAQIAAKQILPSYEAFARFRRLLPWEDSDPRSSTITYWRDRAQALPLYGVRCEACGVTQFPANRACVECSALDRMEPVRLSHRGTIFTFTNDHLVGGEYLETPLPRAVVDLDGGGRIFVEITDTDPARVHTGMRVELTFRMIHEGSGFKHYYWKARPMRGEEAS